MTTTKTNIKENARIFLTDYASYNNGTQFEFGHWVDLDQFSDADELNEYISEHFAAADEKSPLDSPREEVMITAYEGFPEDLYSENMNADSFERLFTFMEWAEKEGLESLENEGDNLLPYWNEYCAETNRHDDCIYHFDSDFWETFYSNASPEEMFRMGKYSGDDFNFGEDYIIVSIYGLETTNDPSKHITEWEVIDWILSTQI
jgi:hypothetical protein